MPGARAPVVCPRGQNPHVLSPLSLPCDPNVAQILQLRGGCPHEGARTFVGVFEHRDA